MQIEYYRRPSRLAAWFKRLFWLPVPRQKTNRNQTGEIAIILLIIGVHIWLGAWIVHWATHDKRSAYECRQQDFMRVDPNDPNSITN